MSKHIDAIVNVPISDIAALRIVAGKADYAGITDYVNVYELDANRIPVAPDGPFGLTTVYESVEDADSVDLEHARVSLLLEPSDTFSALLSYQMQEDDVGGRRQQTPGFDGFGEEYQDYENGSIMLEPSTREVEVTNLEMDFDLGFATLTSSTSAYEHSGDSISENTGFYAQNGWLANFYYSYPRPMAEAFRTYADDATVQEFRLVSNGDEQLDYVVGLFYQDQDRLATQDSYLRGFTIWCTAAFGPGVCVNDNDFSYERNENFEEMSYFGELSYEFTEDFRMTFGVRRFDTESVNVTDFSVGLYASIISGDTATIENDESGTLFKTNFSYDLSDNAMLYGTISEGYRRGGSNAVPTQGNFAEDERWTTYEPDTVLNTEFGIKGSGDNMNYNISLFKVDWEDIQLNVATPNFGFFAVLNGGEAETKGLEAEVNGFFGEDNEWQYSLGFAHVIAEVTEDVISINGAVIADAGNQLPGTPENTLNIGLNHTMTLESGGYLTNRFGWYYQSESQNYIGDFNVFNQTMDNFIIMDYSATLNIDEWYATLWVKNITNEKGSTGIFKEEYMGTSPVQNYFGNGAKEFIALPRTIGVTLTYVF